jgi:hypothetical protein
VEAQTCTHIDVEIGMMHPMQSPQHGYCVKEHMLKVDRGADYEPPPKVPGEPDSLLKFLAKQQAE